MAYLLNLETMIAPGYPIRVIKRLLAKALIALDSIRLEWLEPAMNGGAVEGRGDAGRRSKLHGRSC